MDDPLERSMRQLSDTEKEEILFSVLSIAEDIFSQCTKDPIDFCVQHIDDAAIIFGGTNRLIFNRHGWYISESHCTDKFIENFNSIFKERNK